MSDKIIDKVTDKNFLDFLTNVNSVNLAIIALVVIAIGIMYLKYNQSIQKNVKDNEKVYDKLTESLVKLGEGVTVMNTSSAERDKKYVGMIDDVDSKIDNNMDKIDSKLETGLNRIYDKVEDIKVEIAKHDSNRCVNHGTKIKVTSE